MYIIELKHQAAGASGAVGQGHRVTAGCLLLRRQGGGSDKLRLERPEASIGPAREASSKRARLAGIILVLIVIGALTLGFISRWRQRHVALADSALLVVPTVSVVSSRPEQAGDGLLMPAEIKPWLEASICARANGYLKNWIADIGAHVEAGQLLALIETPDLDKQLERFGEKWRPYREVADRYLWRAVDAL